MLARQLAPLLVLVGDGVEATSPVLALGDGEARGRRRLERRLRVGGGQHDRVGELADERALALGRVACAELLEPRAPYDVVQADLLGHLQAQALEVLPLGRGEVAAVRRLDVADEVLQARVRLVERQAAADALRRYTAKAADAAAHATNDNRWTARTAPRLAADRPSCRSASSATTNTNTNTAAADAGIHFGRAYLRHVRADARVVHSAALECRRGRFSRVAVVAVVVVDAACELLLGNISLLDLATAASAAGARLRRLCARLLMARRVRMMLLVGALILRLRV